MKKFTLPVALCFLLANCQKNDFKVVDEGKFGDATWALRTTLNLPEPIGEYNRKLPDWMSKMGLAPDAVDNKKATLGRVLFYDQNLSATQKVSCASCHKQGSAFADNEPKSKGVHGLTDRNTPALVNSPSVSGTHAEFKGKKLGFFWDDRAASVAEQSRQTFHNPVEMGISAEEAAQTVREKLYYDILWREAYGNFEPTAEQVLECLSEFVGAMGAHDSKFDQGMSIRSAALGSPTQSVTVFDTVVLTPAYYSGTVTTVVQANITYSNVFPLMTPMESLGKDLFIKNCSKCHSPVRTFQEVLTACNGLEAAYADNGIGALTNRAEDMGVFQSPSLKNISRSAPYMHDGRFKTLEQVIDFYSSGIRAHPNLHPLLKNPDGTPKNLLLKVEEKSQLLAFLKTLTDVAAIYDEKFSDPFRQ